MTKKFYAPKGYKAKVQAAHREAVHVPEQGECAVANCIRFVLISGNALELVVTGTWADKCCKAVCGAKPEGTQVAFEIARIDYMEKCNG